MNSSLTWAEFPPCGAQTATSWAWLARPGTKSIFSNTLRIHFIQPVPLGKCRYLDVWRLD